MSSLDVSRPSAAYRFLFEVDAKFADACSLYPAQPLQNQWLAVFRSAAPLFPVE